MKKRLSRLLGGLCAILVLSGCATNITRVDTPPEPPSEKFSTFSKIAVRPVTIDAAFANSGPNQKASAKIQEVLFTRLQEINPDIHILDADEKAPKNALLIEPHVNEIKFIGGAARFWAGALAGSSGINMSAKFTDTKTNKEVANPTFYQHADSRAGAWSFGGADNAMLHRIANLIGDYFEKYQ